MVKSEAARVIDAVIVMGRDTEDRPKLQVRPLPGQGLDTSLNIACARKLREHNPVGTRLRLTVQLTDKEGAPYLYSNPNGRVEILSGK